MRAYLKKTSLILAGVWALSMALAFFVGRQWASDSSDRNENVDHSAVRFEERNPKDNDLNFKEAEDLFSDVDAGHDQEFINPRSVVPSLRAAIKLSDPIKRLQLITLALEGLDSTNVREALALFENQPGGGFDRVRDLNLLMYAWGSFDGSAALDYAANEMRGPGSRFATYTAMSGWAANDPQGAVTWTEENDADSRTVLGLISGWASTDLPGATDYVSGLPEGRTSSRAVGILVSNYLQEGSDYAVAWAESLPDGELKADVVNNLSRQWASVDAPSTAQWIADYADTESGQHAVATVASQWARDDPEAAALWASSFTEDGSRESGLQAVFNRWGGNDPNAAGEWLNSLPPEQNLDPAVDAFARRISGDDPQGAITWAESIIDPDMRLKSVTIVGQEWYRQDPEATSEWVETSQLPSEVQSAILNPPPESRNDHRGPFGGGGF